jgi:aquaporin Z
LEKLKVYLSEALGLGVFMFSAGFFCILIDHPNFHVREIIPFDIVRRFLIGLSMGLTALFIIHSPFGKKSGAHINPAFTLTLFRLKRISAKDSFFYILFQFLGGSVGLYLISLLMPESIKHPLINYIVTVPGKEGFSVAFVLEFIISFFLMLTVLVTSANTKLAAYTSFFVAALITLYITFEAPYSGMSMNPARTFSSAVVANGWTGFWLYCISPVLAMLAAGEIWYRFLKK